MRYRCLGATGLEVGEIGIGTEYLAAADSETVSEVVNEALDRDVNYIDLLYDLPDYRDSFGKALRGKRHKAVITGHIGLAHINGQYNITRDLKVADEVFHDLLTRLETDYIDNIMIQYVDSENLEELQTGGIIDFALKMKRAGKARAVGISSHKVKVALKAVKSGLIDTLMFPVFISRDDREDIKELLHTCSALGVGVIAMKPFGGGKLVWKGNSSGLTPVQCISYVLSQKEISTVVPGVKDTAELRAALDYVDASVEARDFYRFIEKVRNNGIENCLFCNHCLPCPSNINIGEMIRMVAMAGDGMETEARKLYSVAEVRASACIGCGSCSERCFFDIDVVSKMKQAVEIFEK